MTFPSTGPVELRTNLADYPVTRALKNGAITSDLVSFDFAGPKTANEGFKPMVRETAFLAGELAIATFFQAKCYGKPFVLLPAPIVSRSQHHTIAYDSQFGALAPRDLDGKRVGVRSYAVTTVMWVRGLLQHEYGVDLDSIHWMTVEDPHLAEYVDPPNCTRIPKGETLDGLLQKGEIAAAVLGDKLPPSPSVKTLIPDAAAAARAWSARTGVAPVNHMFCVHADLPRERPDVVKEIYRMLAESRAAAPAEAVQEMAPFGFEANRKGLQLAIDWSYEQKLLTRRLDAEELFDDVTRRL